ncbi:MFS general substrate transporter [Cytidiella melzeri]|nr:MFS general substrate transporter [Cytidiella melzeri]
MATEARRSSTSSRSGSLEKGRVEQVDTATDADEKRLRSQLYNPNVDTSSVDEKKLMRKLDWWLIPWLSFLYLLSFLDRTSIGNAKLYGLEKDLGISDTQYNIALTIFFFSYAIFEVPSNVFLKRLRPSVWLSLLMLLWGVMMTVQGLVHNYGGLLGMRWMLGLFEAGLFPGVNYYLSCWYKRSEFGIRAAVFFSAATVSGAFGGLLAAAISNMGGVGGKPAWAWIFILEGLVTVLAGAASFFVIQDFPDTAKFLNEEERTFVIRRLQEDDQFSAAGEKLNMRYIWQSILDWKTWNGMLLYMGSDMPLYAFSLFLPSIINELGELTEIVIRTRITDPTSGVAGFTATPANLLTVPVYTLACIVTCAVGFYADRHGQRGIINMGGVLTLPFDCNPGSVCSCVGAAGYIILIASRNAALSYVGVYLAACGIYPNIPNTIAWMSNNVEGSYKRSVTLAMFISFGNINGAVSSNVYRGRDKPWYRLGHGIVLMYIGIAIVSAVVYRWLLKRENDRRDRGERDEVIVGVNDGREDLLKNGRFATVEEAKREKGDGWSGYRYTL